ncbi:MAG: hypothetical protein ACI97N_001414 [Cognaticolwellia sp.]|jgi:hypothetical protein
MSVKKYYIVGLFLLFSMVKSYGQITSFSESPKVFLDELSEYINASNKPMKPIFDEFSEDILQDIYTAEQFAEIREVANMMVVRKMGSNPYFLAYLECLNAMENKGFVGKQFDGWMSVNKNMLTELKRSKNKDYNIYLQFCADLFENSALRYSTSGLTWSVTTSEYQFNYKDNIPWVTMDNHDLIGIRKVDSIVIKNTGGIYYPLTNSWKGNKGSVDWSRTGFSQEVYCTFENYTINTKTNNYKIDTVTFYHPTFFNEPIEGSFEDKVIVVTGNNISHPRFESFDKNLSIDNMGDNINYRGGFRLEGSSVIGFGDKLSLAEMDFFKKNGELAINTKAERYVIRLGEKVVAQDVRASLYFEQDSIYHPAIDFRFDIKTRQLVMTRQGNGNSQIAFYNSYHQLEMEVEKVAWQIDSDFIEIGQAGLQNVSNRAKKGQFESLAYYNDRDYRRIQNIADYNPISTMRNYSEAIDSRELDANSLAKQFNSRLDLVSIKGLLNNLVEDGFIFYDDDKEIVYVKEKTFHYAEASTNKRDYDVIRANSESRETNGILDLNTKNLTLRGVKGADLSEKQLVGIRPKGGQLIFKKNRDMDFDGVTFAGYGAFFGSNFHFDYEHFLMRLDSVYEFVLRIPTGEKDLTGSTVKLVPLTTLIEDMTAIVEIDTAMNGITNRSSRIPLPRFPRLRSLNNSRVYYSDKGTAGGAYKRDNFFFELDPFVIDSLDGFDTATIKFDGQLVSAEVFPEFREVLRIQHEDLSLGFTTEAPPEGYPLYGGKGTYNKTIKLGNKGLTGEGTVSYLGATINSDDILFKPNSLSATSKSFDVEEQISPVEFPNIHGEEVTVNWKPYKDSMYVRSVDKDKPFEIFNSTYKLDGEIIMTPGGVYGNGDFDWKDGLLYSKSMRFNTFSVDADTSNLNIKTQGDGDELAFSTKNVKSNIDFDKQLGKFKSNSTAINTEMPYTQYKTSMNEFEWDMNKKEISFESTNDNAVFVSTNEAQFGLKFSGERANYNLETNLLKIKGVPEIKVADALIIPNEGLVEIEANAEMKPLEKATIIADTLNRFHVIKDAQTFITSKKSYQANNGTYDYDVSGKKQQIIFRSIIVTNQKKRALVTKANGSLLQANQFIIDKNVNFKGKVELDSRYKALNFDGYSKINVPKLLGAQWFSIDSRIVKGDVLIPITKKTRNEDGKLLEVGLRIEYDSTIIYPLVLTPPYSRRDIEVFSAVGIVKPDNAADVFYFGDSAKILNQAQRGNMMTFRNRDGKVTTEGTYTISGKMKGFEVKAAGESVSYYGQNEVLMNLVIGLGFQIPDKLMTIVVRDLETNSFDVPEANYQGEYFPNALAEFVENEKDLKKVNKELVEYERLFLPKDINEQFNIIFGHVPMVWNADIQSFLSKGNTLGLAYIKGTPINKQTKAHLEFRMARRTDEMNIYIESAGGNYYYFNYRIAEGKGVVSIFSNNKNFMDTYRSMKKKEVQFKTKDIDVVVLPTGPGAVTYFLKRAALAN